MSQPNYQAALSAAIEAAREAGKLLRDAFYLPKGPVDIDHEVEGVLRARLTAAVGWNFLGEELGFQSGTDASHCWVVDPNDGTTEYRRGRRGNARARCATPDRNAAHQPTSGSLRAAAAGGPSARPKLSRVRETILRRGKR